MSVTGTGLRLDAGLAVVRRLAVKPSRTLRLESSVWVDRALDDFPPLLNDPHSLQLWDDSVEQVETHASDPLQVGSTFDTIGPARGRRPGQRTSYRVTMLEPTTNAVEVIGHPLFQRAVWTLQFISTGQRTHVTCSVDLVAKRRYVVVLPLLSASRRALLGDLTKLKALIERDSGPSGGQPAVS